MECRLNHKKYKGLDARKPVFGVCEQQVRRPAYTFVICLLESIISNFATSEISIS